MTDQQIALIVITLGAAIVNGALGYGFSSITVPLALLFMTNRVLNPALVPIEVVLNAYVLWVNREALATVWRRVLPIVIALAPGVALGTMLVSQVNPGWLKFITFIVLLPLILLQAAGYRRPVRSEKSGFVLFGGALGVLYAVTTISGPPLAVVLSNQGLTKKDFRAALGFIRLAESAFTAIAYYYAGLYTVESFGLIPYILPEHRDRRADRRRPDSAHPRGNVPPRLHELRRVGGRLRPLGAAQEPEPGREQRGVPPAGCRRRARHLSALSLLLGHAAGAEAGRIRTCRSRRHRRPPSAPSRRD